MLPVEQDSHGKAFAEHHDANSALEHHEYAEGEVGTDVLKSDASAEEYAVVVHLLDAFAALRTMVGLHWLYKVALKTVGFLLLLFSKRDFLWLGMRSTAVLMKSFVQTLSL